MNLLAVTVKLMGLVFISDVVYAVSYAFAYMYKHDLSSECKFNSLTSTHVYFVVK